MKKYITGLLVSVLFTACGCGPGKKATKNVNLEPLEIKATDNDYRAASPIVWQITHTRVALSFNWKERTADGKAWLTLHPYFYATDTLVLDAKSMRIDSVRLLKGGKIAWFTYINDQLKIKLDRQYYNTDEVELYIQYVAMPYTAPNGGSAAISDDRGLYFVNADNSIPGKPMQIWTQGESESNSHWMPTIDKPNTRFTTQIELTVPDTMQTLSNGYLASSTKLGNGLRKDIWKMDKTIQAYATMFAIGKYTIIKDKWRDKEVNYYVEDAYAPYARKMFNNTPEMMEYFSNITGVPYPWNKYSQVVVRDYVSGAMENTTATLWGEFVNQNSREIDDHDYEDIVSHELFHQWFGDYVTFESWSNLTLSESFATYGEQLWGLHKYGKDYADKLHYDDLNLYLNNPYNMPVPLVRYYYKDREAMFDRISYQKGASILHYLHMLTGDSAFYKAMNIYLTHNALKATEAAHWRLAVEEATGQDWQWFFNQWYYRAGHPVLNVTYNYDDNAKKLIVTVEQTQGDTYPVYQLPLRTALLYGNDKTIVNWNIQHRKEVFTYEYRNGQKPVVVPDHEHWLPGIINENKTLVQWRTQFVQCDDYVNKHDAIFAAMPNIKDPVAQEIITLAMKDKMAYVREYVLWALNKQDANWKSKWSKDVQMMAINDGNSDVRGNAFKLLGKWEVAAARQSMVDALGDDSYYVAGEALEALAKLDSKDAYKRAKEINAQHPAGHLQIAVWDVIGDKGDDNDIAIYEQQAPYIYGSKKVQFGYSLYAYLQHVESYASFERGLRVFRNLIITENIDTYRKSLIAFMFELSKEYRTRSKKTDKSDAGNLQKKKDAIKSYIQKIIAAEKNADMVSSFKLNYPDEF